MAKIVKKKRRKLNITGVAVVMFTLSLLSWLVTSLFVNTANAALTVKIQQMNEEVETLRSENQTLSYTIQSLENKDRVFEVASAADLAQFSDNIISVPGE